MLAGGHCIPVRLPQAARLVWHKLYAATQRHGAPEKAAKDMQQALVLGAVLADDDPSRLIQAFGVAPGAMLAPIRRLTDRLIAQSSAHTAWADTLAHCLKG